MLLSTSIEFYVYSNGERYLHEHQFFFSYIYWVNGQKYVWWMKEFIFNWKNRALNCYWYMQWKLLYLMIEQNAKCIMYKQIRRYLRWKKNFLFKLTFIRKMWTSHKDLICTNKRLAFHKVNLFLYLYVYSCALRIFVQSDFFSRKYNFSFLSFEMFVEYVFRSAYIFHVFYSSNNLLYSSFF